MTMRAVWLAVAGCILVGCSGPLDSQTCCGGVHFSVARSHVTRVPASDVPSTDLQDAVAANNAFALSLFGQILTHPSGPNVLFSPVSASLSLAMASAGAGGATKSQMAQALGWAPDSEGAIFAGQNALSQALNGRAMAALKQAQDLAAASPGRKPEAGDYQVSLVNSLWGERTCPWQEPFLDILAANYGAGVNQQDFVHASDSARITIDDWVSSQTDNQINGLFGPGAFDDRTRLVAVNALYLRLPWTKPFSDSDTAPGYFDDGAGTSLEIDFMHTQNDFPYTDDGQAQIVALPLANQELAALVLLPHAEVSLAEYEAELNAGQVALAVPDSSMNVALSLPRVPLATSSLSLSESLRALGMRDAFDAIAADFSGLCARPPAPGQLYLAEVMQQSVISLQEGGVQVATAGSTVAGDGSGAGAPQVHVDVNRSFVLAIVDRATGTVLMLGHVTDP